MPRWLRNNRPNDSSDRNGWDLRTPLFWLSPRAPFALADACEGTDIIGATGSGKSSGSGQTLALAYLRAGFGGLVLTAKPHERRIWESYFRANGRLADLRVFAADGPYRFTFLDYELSR